MLFIHVHWFNEKSAMISTLYQFEHNYKVVSIKYLKSQQDCRNAHDEENQ